MYETFRHQQQSFSEPIFFTKVSSEKCTNNVMVAWEKNENRI